VTPTTVSILPPLTPPQDCEPDWALPVAPDVTGTAEDLAVDALGDAEYLAEMLSITLETVRQQTKTIQKQNERIALHAAASFRLRREIPEADALMREISADLDTRIRDCPAGHNLTTWLKDRSWLEEAA